MSSFCAYATQLATKVKILLFWSVKLLLQLGDVIIEYRVSRGILHLFDIELFQLTV